jgi:predicted alpha/beta superfamily hydrolase
VRSLEWERRLWVYLPPSYEHGDRTYPVLFAHDGQNLFDDDTSYAGEWRFDETMEELAHDGIEAIVVGIENSGEARMAEYSPFVGGGDTYVDFLVDRVRPLVAQSFRIATDAERTGVIGSSAGGTISLYALVERPDVFGLAGVLSPALSWLGERMFDYVASHDVRGRIYLDSGGRERGAADMQRLGELLRAKAAELHVVLEPDGAHDEAAWARRLPAALRYLIG